MLDSTTQFSLRVKRGDKGETGKEAYVPVRQLFPTPPTAQTTDNQLAEKGPGAPSDTTGGIRLPAPRTTM